MPNDCNHWQNLPPVTAGTPGCEECLKSGGRWVHLRLCLNCGHVGCCDNSPGRHATQHYHGSGHAVMQSFEPGEDWGWCYLDAMPLGPFTPRR